MHTHSTDGQGVVSQGGEGDGFAGFHHWKLAQCPDIAVTYLKHLLEIPSLQTLM